MEVFDFWAIVVTLLEEDDVRVLFPDISLLLDSAERLGGIWLLLFEVGNLVGWDYVFILVCIARSGYAVGGLILMIAGVRLGGGSSWWGALRGGSP